LVEGRLHALELAGYFATVVTSVSDANRIGRILDGPAALCGTPRPHLTAVTR
jgi:hypothetical protein